MLVYRGVGLACLVRGAVVGLLFAAGCDARLETPAGDAPLPRSARATRDDGCALLDDPQVRQSMSAALELKLRRRCDEALPVPNTAALQTRVSAAAVGPSAVSAGSDIAVSNPALDSGGSTQSETTVVATGNVVCAAWNDAGEGFGANGFSGFGFSLDGGETFTDAGPFPNGPGDSNGGDPSLAYSARDNAIYYAALSDLGLSLWRSNNGCQSFSYVGPIHTDPGDDKELMAVDNTPTSPFYGRIYVGWTNFSLSSNRNQVNFSDNGGQSWSAAVSLPGSGIQGQGMWPAVAPNGDVYFALLNRAPSAGGLQTQWIYQSTDGGVSFSQRTHIGTNQLRPEHVASSSACGRQALNGDVRNLSSPQIAIHPDALAPAGYVIHAVYPYDSDGAGADESNVFYRRSTDGAATWSAEVRLNDDATNTDQFFPALAVTPNGLVGVSWYDRRLDPANLLFDRYFTLSTDGGLSWDSNVRISDVSSPVAETNPNFDGLATCYHGDYDHVAASGSVFHIVWSDDRRITATGPNPDVYYDQVVADPSLGRLDAAPAAIACAGSVTFSVADADLAGQGSHAIAVTSGAGDSETLSLQASASEPGSFAGTITASPAPVQAGDGVIQTANGDTISATYNDADDGSGNPAIVTAAVGVDCLAPDLTNIRTETVTGTSATVRADASEPVTAELRYGLSCASLDLGVVPSATSSSPTFALLGLSQNTTYYFTIAATDAVGNGANFDNDGDCYVLTTPDTLFSQDFEAGLGGFTVTGLWHASTVCASTLPGHTTPGTLYYGVDSSCNFNAGLTQGAATSPIITLADTSEAVLELNYFLATEHSPSFDRASVQLAVNGGAFVVVASNYGTGVPLLDSTGSWQPASIDLVPRLPASGPVNIQIRFHFNTIDSVANTYPGFYVDDVELLGPTGQPCTSDADCIDATACTADSCNLSSGECEHVADSSLCDDGLFCNGSESCNPTSGCQPGAAACDDSVACTLDVCDEANDSCTQVADDAQCNDGLFCTGVESCNPSLGCQPGTPPTCAPDANPCTDEVCSPALDACTSSYNTAQCNDGDTCTGGDRCALGSCVGQNDLCVPDGRIFFDNFGSGLGRWIETGEGDWNTESLHTSSGYPGSGSGSPAAHSDTCGSGCTLELAQRIDLRPYRQARLDLLRFVDVELDSGEYLRVELWNGTSWVTVRNWTHGAGDDNVWHAESIDLAAYLNVSNFAVRLVTLSSSFIEHVHVDDVAITTVAGPSCSVQWDCDDGSACTGSETCSAGRCAPGVPLTCNDSNACTSDSCHFLSGCVFSDNSAACNDGNACTDDSCNPATGCVNNANTLPCNDGDACTGGDQCSAGQCRGPIDLCPAPQPIFTDTFGAGLGLWTESGEGDWNTESLHTSAGYPATGSGSPAAHSDTCSSECTITLATPINLDPYVEARLEFLRFVDVELDSGEYLRVELWNGTSWTRVFDWTQGAGDDNVWHAHSVDLAPYLNVTAFRVRFVTKSSLFSEHVHVDDVRVLAR